MGNGAALCVGARAHPRLYPLPELIAAANIINGRYRRFTTAIANDPMSGLPTSPEVRELYFERYRAVVSVSARIRRRISFRLLPPKRSLHQDVKLEIPLVFLKIGSAAAVDREIGVASVDLADECAGVVAGREEAFTCGLPITLGSVTTVRAAELRIEANSSR